MSIFFAYFLSRVMALCQLYNKLGSNLFVCLVVFNTTFNNNSVISWQSVLLVEETGGPEENHRPVARH